MREEEAIWIAEFLDNKKQKEIDPMLDLGSSTSIFRKKYKPHLEKYIFNVLQSRGISVIHSDLKEGEGVDISGDIFDKEIREKLHSYNFRVVLCANMLEHVEDPKGLLDVCLDILSPGGYLIVTVPFSYPYHPDPIDTMFRPSPRILCDMVKEVEIVHAEIITSNSFAHDIRDKPIIGLKHILRLLLPFINYKKWKSAIHRLKWLVKPYLISIIVVKKK
jgi:SAM-dependent methyltransferase